MRPLFIASSLLLLLTVAAHAQANNPVAAQALFEEGRALLARGEFASACAKFEGSESLDPGPGTEYNLALCYEKSERFASAWATYLSAAGGYKATQRPEWEAKARERANALAGSLSKLTIALPSDAPAGVRVTRDGSALVASELGAAIPVDAGVHLIEATVTGRPTWQSRVDLKRGEAKTVVVTFDAAAASSEPSRRAEEIVDGTTQRTWGLVVGGVGVAGLAFGAVSGLVAISDNASSTKECPNDGPCGSAEALRTNASARDWAAVSTVAFAGGGALVAVGLALFFTAPAPAPRTTGHITLTPAVGLGGGGVAGTW